MYYNIIIITAFIAIFHFFSCFNKISLKWPKTTKTNKNKPFNGRPNHPDFVAQKEKVHRNQYGGHVETETRPKRSPRAPPDREERINQLLTAFRHVVKKKRCRGETDKW